MGSFQFLETQNVDGSGVCMHVVRACACVCICSCVCSCGRMRMCMIMSMCMCNYVFEPREWKGQYTEAGMLSGISRKRSIRSNAYWFTGKRCQVGGRGNVARVWICRQRFLRVFAFVQEHVRRQKRNLILVLHWKRERELAERVQEVSKRIKANPSLAAWCWLQVSKSYNILHVLHVRRAESLHVLHILHCKIGKKGVFNFLNWICKICKTSKDFARLTCKTCKTLKDFDTCNCLWVRTPATISWPAHLTLYTCESLCLCIEVRCKTPLPQQPHISSFVNQG